MSVYKIHISRIALRSVILEEIFCIGDENKTLIVALALAFVILALIVYLNLNFFLAYEPVLLNDVLFSFYVVPFKVLF